MCVKDRNLLGIQLHGKTSESRVPTSVIQPHNTFDSPKRMHVKPPHLEGGREGGREGGSALPKRQQNARIACACTHGHFRPSDIPTHQAS